MNRPLRPSADPFLQRLWGRRRGLGRGSGRRCDLRSLRILWVWQSSWQGHKGPLAKARLGRRGGGVGESLLSCHSLVSRWSARAGGVGGGRERGEGGS